MPNSRIEVYNGKYVDDQMANGIPEGGTTGQVLKKTSNDDYDVEWGTGGGGSGTVTSVGLSAGTGISVGGTNPVTTSGTISVTNTAPDQIVVLNAGTGIGVTGTYPNFTITNSSPSSGGTVTSVAALALGTTGTDLTSTVANSTTTPVITLNVPTASATNRGALSSTDWTTFNNKMSAFTLESDWVAPYNYLGEALPGSSTSASVWTIRRIQVSSSGATTTLSSAPNVKWTDRYTVVYS